MSTQLITAPQIGETTQIAITEEGENRKSRLLSAAAHIQSIAEVSIRDVATIRAGEIKSHLADVEKTRKEIKEPFFRTGQAIDKAAAEHVKELELELSRLNNLVGSFEKARREKQEAEERARGTEADRVAREAEEARLEALRVAEEARKEEEPQGSAILSKKEIALLIECSRGHYDADCKHAAKPGGVLDRLQKTPESPVTLRELNLISKILEVHQHVANPKLVAPLTLRLDAEFKRMSELHEAQKTKAMEAQLEADEKREELAAEARRIEATRMDAALKAQQSVPTGGSLRLDVEIEVTDFHALYTACHQAVRMVPDLPFIKAMWKSKVEYPGVIYRERSNFVTRKQ